MNKKERAKAATAKWRAKNPEKFTAGQKKWRMANRDRVSATQHRADIKRYYRMSSEDYAAMLAEQGGVCAVCKQPETETIRGKVRRLAVDHDHATGKVRGLLCGRCNRFLIAVDFSVERIEKLIAYREKHAC